MRINARTEIIYYVLPFLVLWLCYCESDGADRRLIIYRYKRNIFSNLNCPDDSEKCIPMQCNMYGASCVNGRNCMFCRCLEGRNTFVTGNNDGHGECKSDLEVLPESGYYSSYSSLLFLTLIT